MGNFFLLALIIAIFVFYNVTNKRDLLSPGNLFTLIILSTFAIACLHFSNLQHNYPVVFMLQIILVVLFFAFGSNIKIKSIREEKEYNCNLTKLKNAIYFLFIVVMGAFAIMWIKLGPPPAISKADRYNYFLSGIGTLYLMIDVLTFLLIYDLFTYKVIGKKTYIMLFFCLLAIVLMANKFQLIYLICQYLILYNLLKKKIRIKTLGILGIIILLIFFIFYAFIYKGMYISNDDMYRVNKMNFSEKFSMLTTPYIYIAFNYENLYHYMSLNNVEYGYGFYILQDLVDGFELKELLYENSNFLSNQWKYNLQYRWLTTGTMFKEFYMDFGYIGMLVGSSIIGYISKVSYVKRKKSLFYTFFYVSNMVSIFLAFFTNNFVSINYLINIFIASLISRYCYTKKINKKQEKISVDASSTLR